MPIIIRIDGKAFHTYTRGMKKPFDEVLGYAMRETTRALCKDVHTCVFGYTQSDEITLVLKLPDRVKSQEYLNRRVQKLASLTASKATRYFNKFFTEEAMRIRDKYWFKLREEAYNTDIVKNVRTQQVADKLAERYADKHIKSLEYMDVYLRKIGNAEFDSRAFNVPEWDCINNIIWRQQDAARNSVEMVGHCYFSAKQLDKVNVEQIKEKLLKEIGIDWETDFNSYQKYGACCYKVKEEKEIKGKTVVRNKWHIDIENNKIIQIDRHWFSEVTGLREDI